MQSVVNGVLTGYHLQNPQAKTTLLILPGWGHTQSEWSTVQSLLPQTVRSLVLDLPGFGSSQALPGQPSVPEYSQFVFDFIKKQKLKNFSLLGHSYGGQVALDLALRHPKLIRHLLLLSPAVIRDNQPSTKSSLVSLLKPIKNVFPSFLKDHYLRHFASSDYYHSNKYQRALLNRILYVDYRHRLKDLKVQTSILWGSEDQTIPDHSRLLAETIPSSDLHILYGQDHNPHLSSPQKLAQLISVLLQDHD